MHKDQLMPELCNIKDIHIYLPFMTEQSLRWNIHKDKKFKQKCTRKFGRRIFAMPKEIIEYIKNQE